MVGNLILSAHIDLYQLSVLKMNYIKDIYLFMYKMKQKKLDLNPHQDNYLILKSPVVRRCLHYYSCQCTYGINQALG